jgi:hypothetical protein
MLKVVYDAANELEDAAQNEAAANSLFEDDDEEDDEPSIAGKSYKSSYSLVYGSPSQNKLTWATMLRQMKSEFKDVGYAQAPKITTTRKIDLNQPFSLAPDNFDPRTNKKRSLLIGCNYRDIQGAELNASHDDIRSMKVSTGIYAPYALLVALFAYFGLLLSFDRTILSTFMAFRKAAT